MILIESKQVGNLSYYVSNISSEVRGFYQSSKDLTIIGVNIFA